MPKNRYKEVTKVRDGGIQKIFHHSLIIEKAIWYYRETSDDGRLVVHFRSGIVYDYKNVKPRFAEAFMNSTDNQVGTSFNKYIHNHFVTSEIKKTKKFYETIEKARKVDLARKARKTRERAKKARENKKHAELV